MSNCFHPDVQLLLASFKYRSRNKKNVMLRSENRRRKAFSLDLVFVSPFREKSANKWKKREKWLADYLWNVCIMYEIKICVC